MNKILDAYKEFKAMYYTNEEAIMNIDYSQISDNFISTIEKRSARKYNRQCDKFAKIK